MQSHVLDVVSGEAMYWNMKDIYEKFSKETSQMAKKHLMNSSTFLVIWKTQILNDSEIPSYNF